MIGYNRMIKVKINGKEKSIIMDKDNIHIGINSGKSYQQQWIFLDIDNKTKEEIEELARKMMVEEHLRRIVIVKSTDKHNGWHVLSFSPKKYDNMIDIISKYGTDEKHLAKAQDNGYATIRLTPKDIAPKVHAIINNTSIDKQLNFYDYDAEKAYLYLLNKWGGIKNGKIIR